VPRKPSHRSSRPRPSTNGEPAASGRAGQPRRPGARGPKSGAPNSSSSAAKKPAPPAREPLHFVVDRPRLKAPAAFLAASAEFGLDFEPGELDRYGHYLALLLANNDLLNLTAITEPEQAWMRHIFDSLTLLPLFEPTTPAAVSSDQPGAASDAADAGAEPDAPADQPSDGVLHVCDIGSGGGAPGLVLAIARPDVRFTLVESTTKKAEFLETVITELALTNAQVLNARAEEVGAFVAGQGAPGAPKPLGLLHRGHYDLVTARAVGRIAIVAEWCVPLARIGGRVALIKGEKADEELAEARQALHLLHTHHVATLDTPTGRVVVLEKQRKTPALYPRKVGEARRRPLGLPS
jgi:16S rRNA (guanine527-N7)-methyltransferase